MLIKATKFKTEERPVLKPAEKLSFTVSPSIVVIEAGPLTACVIFTPLKRLAIPVKDALKIFQVSFPP